MSKARLMDDPFYSAIMFEIELDFLKDFITDARNDVTKLSERTMTRWWARVVQAVRGAVSKRDR